MTYIEMSDEGDLSVGINPTHIEIYTNIHFDKKDYKEFYNLARDWFDLGGTITICIGENRKEMECWAGKKPYYTEEPIFWRVR
ncbi:MAG: hypothetical protein DRM98_00075 [Thermoplasmata archaeon]|nr:MAG: hypothetical protein DRM98_00075 [Thermoplasmata archaeon]